MFKPHLRIEIQQKGPIVKFVRQSTQMMYSSIFVSTVYVFGLFYQHYFMIEKIKEFLPQSAGKCISKGLILKIFLEDMPLDLSRHSGPWGLCCMAIGHVLELKSFLLPLLQNLITALLTSSVYQSKGGFPLSDIFYVHK